MNLLLAENPGIDIFGFRIYYYALCIMTGVLVATAFSALLMKRRNISPDFIFTLFIFCIPAALICARLFYCITDGMEPKYWFMWDDGYGHGIRNGGLSIIGGVIGGVGTGVIVCAVKKLSFFRVADCVVVTILIAQAIGRWGNYFNQEVYGSPITDPAQQWFPWAVYIEDMHGYYHAFFFYEGFINAIGFAILYSSAWFFKKKPNGIFVFAYFLWYGTVRAVMEPLRDPTFILSGGGVPWSLVFSILMILLGVSGILTLLLWNFHKEGAFWGSKKGDPCGISDYLTPYKDEQPYFSKINLFGANYPPKPQEKTFQYRWNQFLSKWKKDSAPEEEKSSSGKEEESNCKEKPSMTTQDPSDTTKDSIPGKEEETFCKENPSMATQDPSDTTKDSIPGKEEEAFCKEKPSKTIEYKKDNK